MLSERHRLLAEFLLLAVGVYFLTLPWLSPAPRARDGNPSRPEKQVKPNQPKPPPKRSTNTTVMLPQAPDLQAAHVYLLLVETSATGPVQYQYKEFKYHEFPRVRVLLTGLMAMSRGKAKLVIRRAGGANLGEKDLMALQNQDAMLMPLIRLCEEIEFPFYLEPINRAAKTPTDTPAESTMPPLQKPGGTPQR